MRITVFKILCLILCGLLQTQFYAQETPQISEKTLTKLAKDATNFNEKLDNTSKKYLKRLEKQERRFARKLSKKDSTSAKILLDNITKTYSDLNGSIDNKIKSANRLKEYLPNLDSTTTMLQFINENELYNKTSNYIGKAKTTLSQYQNMQDNFKTASNIKEVIKARKTQLLAMAERHSLTKHLKKYNKAAYYYSAQIDEYKNILKNPAKLEKLLLAALQKLPAFKDFFAKFSQMGQLFPQQNNGVVSLASLNGLQTRAQLASQIQTIAQQVGNGNTGGGMNIIQQQVQQAQNQVNTLRDRIQNAGGNSSDFEMPEFTPNTQKTKSFLKRFELKTDLQTTKGNNSFPNMADLALGFGYKLSDNKNIGFLAAFKMGMGTGWNNINITTQGLGLRSFADFKFNKKANIWISGGYERNYFTQPNLSNYTGTGLWNEAAVAGISKKAQIGKKRKAEFKLLYNFLWKNQPGSQQFIYRTGINF